MIEEEITQDDVQSFADELMSAFDIELCVPDEYDTLYTTDCMLAELQLMVDCGITELGIYYAEIIEDNIYWSVDVMQDHLNNACETWWTWTVTSLLEDIEYRKEYNDTDDVSDYEIIVDAKFSDDVLCKAIEGWLAKNGITGLTAKMMDLEDVEGSGYVKDLMEMDIDQSLDKVKPFDMDDL